MLNTFWFQTFFQFFESKCSKASEWRSLEMLTRSPIQSHSMTVCIHGRSGWRCRNTCNFSNHFHDLLPGSVFWSILRRWQQSPLADFHHRLGFQKRLQPRSLDFWIEWHRLAAFQIPCFGFCIVSRHQDQSSCALFCLPLPGLWGERCAKGVVDFKWDAVARWFAAQCWGAFTEFYVGLWVG